MTGGLTVSDDEVRRAMKFALEYLNIVVEPGGAVALAAVLEGKIDTHRKNIGLMVSGGNLDTKTLMEMIGD